MGFVCNLVRSFGISLVYLVAFRDRTAGMVSGGLLVLVVAAFAYRNMTAVFKAPKSSTVPQGKIRICVAGYTHSSATAKAHYLADKIVKAYPDKFESWYYFDQYTYWQFVRKFDNVPFPEHLKGFATSPFCWLERTPNAIEPIGGAVFLSKWVLANPEIKDLGVRTLAARRLSLRDYITGWAFHCEDDSLAATAQ